LDHSGFTQAYLRSPEISSRFSSLLKEELKYEAEISILFQTRNGSNIRGLHEMSTVNLLKVEQDLEEVTNKVNRHESGWKQFDGKHVKSGDWVRDKVMK
jgi:hypothetical protein